MKICYFGIYDPDFSRNKVYISGLVKNGVTILKCRDTGRGIMKYWRLYRKHRIMSHDYDAMIVGYPGHIVVPLARLLSSKPVIFDALCTMSEAERFSHRAGFIRRLRARIIDHIAVKCAHIVLVESEPQREFFVRRFGGDRNKYQTLYTGADDEVFSLAEPIKKLSTYTVLFRGSLTPESGIDHILKAAQLIRDEYHEGEINFRFVGRGKRERETRDLIWKLNLHNVELVSGVLPWHEMVRNMKECHVSLGQFDDNERLKRTIPHKAFESMALKLPYITSRAPGIQSLLTDGENCLMVNVGDARDLAQKILQLKNDQVFADKIAENGYRLFKRELTPAILASKIISFLR